MGSLKGVSAVRQIPWTQRSFSFDFPAGVFPGIVERLRGTPARIGFLVDGVPDATLARRHDGGWSVKRHIGHLDDLDALDRVRLDEFLKGARVLTAADMGNRRTEEADHDARPVGELLATFATNRLALVARLETLTGQDVVRRAEHPRLNLPMRLVDWAFFVAEHDDHHLARMRASLRAAGEGAA
ncbi:MAG: DinB family protein [Longimicrobiales bacterium]